MSTVSEQILWTKYNLFAPPKNRVSKSVFHKLFLEYKQHPERKEELLNKLKTLSKNKGRGGASKTTVKKRRRNKRITRRRY